jgi:threonine/homoserine/homoserine lactone efflux protein
VNPASPSHRRFVVLTVVAGCLGVANCVLLPRIAFVTVTLFSVAMMVWMCVRAHRKMRNAENAAAGASSRGRAEMREYEWVGLLVCGVLIGCAIRSLGIADGTTIDRAMGVLWGTFFIAAANWIPKRPQGTGLLSGANYAIRRFAGWVFTTAGVVDVAAYLFAPSEVAPHVALAANLGAMAIVGVRVATDGWSPRRTR